VAGALYDHRRHFCIGELGSEEDVTCALADHQLCDCGHWPYKNVSRNTFCGVCCGCPPPESRQGVNQVVTPKA
jgi:hypothetical protein